MTPLGIDPATFWFVVQCLNHCTTAMVTQMLQELSYLCREGKVGWLSSVRYLAIETYSVTRLPMHLPGRPLCTVMGVCCDVRTAVLRVVSLGMMNGSVRRTVSCELVNQPDMCDRLPSSPSGRRNSLPRASGWFTFTFLIGTTAW
jgi:hypothetical protein